MNDNDVPHTPDGGAVGWSGVLERLGFHGEYYETDIACFVAAVEVPLSYKRTLEKLLVGGVVSRSVVHLLFGNPSLPCFWLFLFTP